MHNRVLVTGGAGYVGSHAVAALKRRGYEVVVYDNLSTGTAQAVRGVELHVADIRDEETLQRVIGSGCTAVMHFAGSVSVPESITNPGHYFENNTKNTLRVLDACRLNNVKALVFSSTAAIYGNPLSDSLVTEGAACLPINPYGASKLMAERMVRDCAGAYGGRFGILRYFNVAGADPGGEFGPHPPSLAPNLINNLCAALLSNRPFTVYGKDYPTADGTCVRDFIHVSDLVDVHILMLEQLLAGHDSIIMNCGYGNGYSVLDVVRAGEDVTGRKVCVTFAERRAGDPARVVADVSLLRSRLDWRPRWDDLRAMIRHSLNWHARAIR